MATFNIYGCCICRDLFNVDSNVHEVKHFLQATSPISNFIFPSPPKRLMTFDDLESVSMRRFRKTCVIKDYNKELVTYFKQKADYFIIDLINMVDMNLIKETYEDGSSHYFTKSSWFLYVNKYGLDDFFENSQLDEISSFDLIRKIGIDSVLDKQISWLKSLGYEENQIILIENKKGLCYTDGKIIAPFGHGIREQMNSIVDEIHRRFEERYPNCHIIRRPWGSYCDERNPWTLSDLHYTQDYYDYLYQCVDAISKYENPKEKLTALWEQYSDINSKSIWQYLHNNFSLYKGDSLLRNGDFSQCSNSINNYIALKGAEVFNESGKKTGENLDYSTQIDYLAIPYSRLSEGSHNRYVSSNDCVRGVVGNNKDFAQFWKTVNNTTCVIVKDHSIILTHNGIDENSQADIVQTINTTDDLYGKPVTLSAWIRVLQLSDYKKMGGVIGLINESNYNKGSFYAKKLFNNTEWQKIQLTTTLPTKTEFKGLTICLRAAAGHTRHAVVEFAQVKLEYGRISTI